MYDVHVALNAEIGLKFDLELNRLNDIYGSFPRRFGQLLNTSLHGQLTLLSQAAPLQASLTAFNGPAGQRCRLRDSTEALRPSRTVSQLVGVAVLGT